MKPHGPTLALVTPSYVNDFERCALLADTVKRFIPAEIQHVIIVERSDGPLFQQLADARTTILLQEDLVQEKTWRLPFLRKWRLSPKAPPIRGWIWQQLVKISIAAQVDAEAYLMLDSDCFFTAPFDPRTLLQDGRVPLFREVKAYYKTNYDNQKWHEVARRLLKLPPQQEPAASGYVSMNVFWRRDVLQQMCAFLNDGGAPRHWVYRIARNLTFSEYVLYGVYVEAVLGVKNSGHELYDGHLCHNYWLEFPLTKADLQFFKRAAPADRPMVMINAKSNTSVPLIREVFFGAS